MLGLLGSNFGNKGIKTTGPPEGWSSMARTGSATLSSTHSHYSQIFLPCKRLPSSWNLRHRVQICTHFGSGVSRPLWTSPYHQLRPPVHRNLHMWVEIMVPLSISYVGFNFLICNIKQLGPKNPKIPLQLLTFQKSITVLARRSSCVGKWDPHRHPLYEPLFDKCHLHTPIWGL